MQANRMRARHYEREARRSDERAELCRKRGDIRGAKSWARIAEGEREAAAFWSSDAAPIVDSLPAFMLESAR